MRAPYWSDDADDRRLTGHRPHRPRRGQMTDIQAAWRCSCPTARAWPAGSTTTSSARHGVEVDRLVALGLPVVPGLTVPVVARRSRSTEPGVARAAVDLLQQLAGRRFDDPNHPLLIRLLAGTPVGGRIGHRRRPARARHHRRRRPPPRRAGRQRRRGLRRVRRGDPLRRRARRRRPGRRLRRRRVRRHDTGRAGRRVPRAVRAPPAAPFPDDPAEQLACAAGRRCAAGPRRARAASGAARACPTTSASRSTSRPSASGRRRVCGHGVADEPRPGHRRVRADRQLPPRRAPHARPTTAPASRSTRCPAAATCSTSALRTLELHMRGAAARRVRGARRRAGAAVGPAHRAAGPARGDPARRRSRRGRRASTTSTAVRLDPLQRHRAAAAPAAAADRHRGRVRLAACRPPPARRSGASRSAATARSSGARPATRSCSSPRRPRPATCPACSRRRPS